MKEILEMLMQGKVLDQTEARGVLTRVASGVYTDIEIASFLTVYLMRKITSEELTGFRDALLDLAVPVNLNGYDIMDVCGTGGDGKNTFNISTLTAFVVAGAGAKVVKHGNSAASSAAGSSDIMQFFGYTFSNRDEKLKKELEETGITYLHAPLFHPALKNVAPVRKALKLKTFFNILGPMVNPARPAKQLIGVFNKEVQDIYAEVYAGTSVSYALVYSLDGYDEISLTSDFRLMTNRASRNVTPAEISLGYIQPRDISGGNNIKENASIFLSILQGEGTPAQNDVVLANATVALQCYFPDMSREEALQTAKESLLGRKAHRVFEKLISLQP